MPSKTLQIALGAAGIAAVLLALLLLVNPAQAARTGPRWRRRLLMAGLGLLAGLGFAPAGLAVVWAGPSAVAPGPELAASPEWKRVVAAWEEANEIASRKRGDYPFDEAGKKHLLEALEAGKRDLADLAAAGKLGEAEGTFLAKDLDRLARRVGAYRPSELRNATCYIVMALATPPGESLERLQDRLPLLEKLAGSKTLHPEALARVIAAVEQDVQVLTDPAFAKLIPEKDRPAREGAVKKARATLERLKARLARP